MIAAVVVETSNVSAVRGELRQFLRPNQRRVHMAKESSARRRQFAALICGLPLERCAVATRLGSRSMPKAREPLMAALTAELVAIGVASWIIEAIGEVQERRDRRVIAQAVRRLDHRDEFMYDHRPPHSEPLLWAADCLAWLALEHHSTEIDVLDVP